VRLQVGTYARLVRHGVVRADSRSIEVIAEARVPKLFSRAVARSEAEGMRHEGPGNPGELESGPVFAVKLVSKPAVIVVDYHDCANFSSRSRIKH
jgi:hypothetical protein